jgi:alkyl hydroperoxide reductase subunit AhpC
MPVSTCPRSPGTLSDPVLTDPAHAVSATYGVAIQMGIHAGWSNRPATFIIDGEEVLRYRRRCQTYDDRPTPRPIFEQLAQRNQPWT